MITNALSVDVEEYYHAAIFRAGVGSGRQFESRVQRSVDVLLELLREHHARATFFVVGEVALQHPAMVRAAAAAGHEIGCHSDRHQSVDRQTLPQFRADVRQAKARIEDAIGDAVVGYRAPNFSIGPAQAWAYEVLVEQGFRYDSSVYPIFHDRYGDPSAPRFPYEIYRRGSDSLVEFPIGTVRFLGVNLPVGGGGFFRLLPSGLTRAGILHVNAAERRPVMFYLHPWELDPGQPRLPMAWRYRYRHYMGLEREQSKLAALLRQFRFGTAREVLDAQGHAAGLRAVAPVRVAPAIVSQ